MERGNGNRRWEPNSLPSSELKQILQDVLADLWADSYRRGDRTEAPRIARFKDDVEIALYCATGHRLRVKRGGE